MKELLDPSQTVSHGMGLTPIAPKIYEIAPKPEYGNAPEGVLVDVETFTQQESDHPAVSDYVAPSSVRPL